LSAKALAIKEAKQKIAKFCAYRERCQQEVRDKLYSYGLATPDVEEIIYELSRQNFLNEERFAISYVRGKFLHNKWGRNKIIQHLKLKRVSDYCIKKGLKEIDEQEYIAVIKDLAIQKRKQYKGLKEYQRNYKAVQFLVNKGYESSLVWSVLKGEYD
jgi:regulatory protein